MVEFGSPTLARGPGRELDTGDLATALDALGAVDRLLVDGAAFAEVSRTTAAWAAARAVRVGGLAKIGGVPVGADAMVVCNPDRLGRLVTPGRIATAPTIIADCWFGENATSESIGIRLVAPGESLAAPVSTSGRGADLGKRIGQVRGVRLLESDHRMWCSYIQPHPPSRVLGALREAGIDGGCSLEDIAGCPGGIAVLVPPAMPDRDLVWYATALKSAVA